MKHRITFAIWLGWVAAVATATLATLAARAVGVLVGASPVGRAAAGLRARLAASAQSRSYLIAGSTVAVFLMAALWGAAWIIGLVAGPASLIRHGLP